MAPTEGRIAIAKSERRWDCRRGTPEEDEDK